MRLRKKPWVRQELNECEFFINNPYNNIGKWHKCFKRKLPIHIELGCGKGKFIAKIASNNININYIAIDIKSEVLGLAKRNIEKEYLDKKIKIDNILLMVQEIEIIKDIFNKNDTVDRIYINFCNPWPKRRHNKKRLTYPKQLEQYKIFLKPNGEIYFKTDDNNLFEDSIKYFLSSGFEIVKKTSDLSTEDIFEKNILTEHEEMFAKQGIKIKAIIAKLKVG